MKDREHRRFCSHPKTHNEAKKSFDEDAKPLIRPARRRCHLANAWNDKLCRNETSWKDRRKTKYHVRDVEDMKIEFTLIGSSYSSKYYEVRSKLESMGFFIKVRFVGEYPYKKIILTYRGTKIRIPKNAKYIT